MNAHFIIAAALVAATPTVIAQGLSDTDQVAASFTRMFEHRSDPTALTAARAGTGRDPLETAAHAMLRGDGLTHRPAVARDSYGTQVVASFERMLRHEAYGDAPVRTAMASDLEPLERIMRTLLRQGGRERVHVAGN